MLRTARATEAGIVYHVLNRGLSLPFAAPAGLENGLESSDAPFSSRFFKGFEDLGKVPTKQGVCDKLAKMMKSFGLE